MNTREKRKKKENGREEKGRNRPIGTEGKEREGVSKMREGGIGQKEDGEKGKKERV